MRKVIELVKKNFKLLVRARISSLVIFIGPLLLVALLGLAYSQSSVFTLAASVYSDNYAELSNSLVTKMENKNFRIMKEASMDNCISSVKRRDSQACIIFPGGMDANSGKTYEIAFYVDYSQMNIVWLMLDVMSARVSERSGELSKEMTGDLLNRIWFVEEKLTASQSTISKIKNSANSVKSASEAAKSGVTGLDISVDFGGIDAEGTKNAAENISASLADITSKASSIINSSKNILEEIEDAATNLESISNDSAIIDEASDIDDAVDRIERAIENATAAINRDSSDASAKALSIKTAMDLIAERLSETQAKMSDVKSKRDSLIPQFEKMSGDITSMLTDITSLDSAINEALQKILVLKGKSAESIAAPITTKIEPITAQKTHFNSLFPTLLVLIMMITGVLLASTLIVVDKKSKAFFRNSFTPTSHFLFSISTYITSLAVLFIQLMLFVSVSAFLFEANVIASILTVLLIVFLSSTVFICIGMFVGYLFKTEETATLAAITIATLMLLFSNAVIPLESLSNYLKQIAMLNPFVISELALRQAVLFQFSFAKMAHSLLFLAGYAVAALLILLVAQSALQRISLVHFKKMHFKSILIKEKKADSTVLNPHIPAVKSTMSTETKATKNAHGRIMLNIKDKYLHFISKLKRK